MLPDQYKRAAMQVPSRPSDRAPVDVPIGAIVDRLQYSGSVDSLRELIQELSAGWDDLSEREKRRLIIRIEQKSGDLVHRSRVSILPQMASRSLVNVLPKTDVYLSRLTWRELQTLAALMEGRSTSQIADGFGISDTTVRTHVKSILAKLGVHSRLEAVAVARSRISRRRMNRVT
jgi:DNA-binding CsgD family transcriptional regulator